MRIAIVDDAAVDRMILAETIKEAASSCRCRTDIEQYENGEELLSAFRPFSYSLIFLDIYMEGLDGIETAKKIRETDPGVKIIFVTSSSDHMPEAFDVHAYQYLKKSDGKKAEFQKVTALLTEIQKEQSEDPKTFHFIAERQEAALPYSDILCAESNGHYTIVTDRKLKKYRIRMAFSEAEAALSTDRRFLTVNRGILVNMDCILSFEDGICTLVHDITFPVNVKKKREISEKRQNYIASRAHDDMKSGRTGQT